MYVNTVARNTAENAENILIFIGIPKGIGSWGKHVSGGLEFRKIIIVLVVERYNLIFKGIYRSFFENSSPFIICNCLVVEIKLRQLWLFWDLF